MSTARAAGLSVVLAGGGSAGHISPALALAEQLRRDDPSVRITALGTARGLETRLVPAAGFDLELIPSVPLPRRPSPDLLRVPGKVVQAVAAARRVLEVVDADVLVGFGSYVALPGYLAARRARVPYVVHEANMRPGMGNRIGARLTPYVGVVVPEIMMRGARVVGMPLRGQIARLDRHAQRDGARAALDLDADRPTLLVTGGSQGARSINTALAGALDRLQGSGIQILHILGPKNELPPAREGDGPVYRPVSYVDRMDQAYAAADFVLCRSGMNTVCELTAIGLPAAYVPLPIGNGEQRLNAAPVAAAGGGLLVDDHDLAADWIVENVVPILTDAARLSAMGAAAAARGHRGAEVELAAWVREVAK
ncbi:MAG: undecaprenyldiphospho-muramoylpentapeptide beta-N-acetylglucosaminyltransferase [Mycobacteriales bacterium]